MRDLLNTLFAIIVIVGVIWVFDRLSTMNVAEKGLKNALIEIWNGKSDTSKTDTSSNKFEVKSNQQPMIYRK
jgi:hypothetical protein